MSQYSLVRTGQVRIGDAERDGAVSALAEHFVAGRLTKEEFEERSDQATQARYAGDLTPLFADLPDPAAASPRTWSAGWSARPGPRPAVRLVPALMMTLMMAMVMGLVAVAVVLAAPWLLWLLFGMFLFHGPWGRGRRHHSSWHHHR